MGSTPQAPENGAQSPASAIAGPFPPSTAARMAALLLNRHSAHEIAEAVEVLVDVLDLMGGDPEAEDATDLEDDFSLSAGALRNAEPGSGCNLADAGGPTWTEWHTRGRFKTSPGIVGKDGRTLHEDAEEDDPSGQCDEDGVNTAYGEVCYTNGASGARCPIADPGGCQHDREPDTDAEREQMGDDVPVLPVVTLDHNLFTDQRRWHVCQR